MAVYQSTCHCCEDRHKPAQMQQHCPMITSSQQLVSQLALHARLSSHCSQLQVGLDAGGGAMI